MEGKSEPDWCGIKLKKTNREPKATADQAYQSGFSSFEDLGPLPALKPLQPLPFDARNRFYHMTGDKLMVIFSHSKYDKSHLFWRYKKYQPKPRKYTDRDVRRLKQVFEDELGFDIVHHPDLIYDEIYDTVKKLSELDHRNTSCVCIVVLTHGEPNGEVLAKDRPYELQELVTRLQNGNDWLVGKPKLFFVQACRGGEVDPGRVQLDNAGGLPLASTHADTLVVKSSVEGYVSWKDEDGSWLIQELCRVVHATHRDLDILQMTTMVTSLIALDRASNTEDKADHNTKQTPEAKSTLTKLLRFSPPYQIQA